MIVHAILGSLAALAWSVVVVLANGMQAAPARFAGGATLIAAWVGAAFLWLAWWIG